MPIKKFNYIFLISGLVLIAAIFLSPVPHALAQSTVGWSNPETIPSFDLDFVPPILIADQNRTVHAFSTQHIETPEDERIRAVVYNKWTLETGWTSPIDILLSPIKEARVTDAYLDIEGYVHLVFFGGDGTDADIYYSKVLLSEADNARAWSKPIVIGDEASDPEGAVISKTDQGNLVVIYNGKRYGNGLYVVRSDDGGNSWSYPTPIFITDDEAPNIFNLEALKSDSGWLHIIWNVYAVNGQGRATYYARSPNGESWEQPILLVETKDGLGSQTPTIIEHDGTLFAIYNLPLKITMQRSLDNGATWQDPAIMFPRHVGVNGSLSLVIDSNDDLHLFFGQRIDATSTSSTIIGMWHSRWRNNRWSEPEAVIKGSPVNDLIGDKSFDPNAARAVVVQGNVILVTWRTDPGLKANGVWYSYKIVEAPELPIIPLPSGLLTYSGTDKSEMATELPNNFKTPEPSVPEISTVVNDSEPSPLDNVGFPITAGFIAFILVLAYIGFRLYVNNGRPRQN